MSSYGLYLVIIIAGALQALGNSMNAQLKTSLVNPWLASIVSFGLILIFFVGAFAIIPKPLPTIASIESMPWWAPIGGLAGALAVFCGLMLVNKIGAGPFNGMIITANIVASLAIDHFGLLNMPIHPINALRVLGGVLMIIGIMIISKF